MRVSFMDVQSSNILHSKLFATFIVLILLIPSAASLSYDNSSFSLTGFNPNFPNVILNGDAYISDLAIQLTRNQANKRLNDSFGRAIYPHPVHLWDKTTGNLADFTTKFSFIINAGPNNTWPADGLAFFLAPNGSSFPGATGGGGLALGTENTTSDPNAAFVAVEFDTYPNKWDPFYRHIGIDINSVNSSIYDGWPWNKIGIGGRVNASITYSSATQTLEILAIDATSVDHGNSTNSTYLEFTTNVSEYLPEWVVVGFSATTGTSFETHAIYSWEFSSSLQVPDKHENNNQTTSQSPPPPSLPLPLPSVSHKSRSSNRLVWIFTSAGIFLFITVILGSAWFSWHSWQKKNKRNEAEDDEFMPPMDEEFEKAMGPRKFSYSELARATDNFADQRLLGEGGFGRVFEGYLSSINLTVAIKKVTPESKQGMKEFASEVLTISQLRHKNLVQLIGWCREKKDLLLIYEFMTNGSLDFHLFKGKTCLIWEMRYKIARDLASALLYLHDAWERCVVHRDIKTSNIMLDSSFNAKLGDFGLARLVDHAKGSQTTVVAGTLGYLAPECVYTGKASRESDVYSFGVVLLEIACGRRVFEPMAADGNIRLVDWVWELYGVGKLLDAADPKLEGNFQGREIECLMIVGLWCVHPDYKLRPTIREAIRVLNYETSPPILPSKLPAPTYYAPLANMSTLSLISSYSSVLTSDGGNYTSESSTSTTNFNIISSSSSSSLLLNSQ